MGRTHTVSIYRTSSHTHNYLQPKVCIGKFELHVCVFQHAQSTCMHTHEHTHTHTFCPCYVCRLVARASVTAGRKDNLSALPNKGLTEYSLSDQSNRTMEPSFPASPVVFTCMFFLSDKQEYTSSSIHFSNSSSLLVAFNSV